MVKGLDQLFCRLNNNLMYLLMTCSVNINKFIGFVYKYSFFGPIKEDIQT